MRVVHAYKVFKPEIEGGIPEVIDILSRGLAARGHENEVVVARNQGRGFRETMAGIRIERAFSFGTILSLPIAPAYPFILRRAAKSADIVALHAPFPLADPVVASLPSRTGLVVHWHSDIIRQRLSGTLLAPLRRLVLERADKIIVTHEGILEHTEVLKPYRDKAVIIPYGIDVDRWKAMSPADEAAVSRLRERHPVLFVSVGRLVTYKGYDVLLNALREVEGHLVICGEGPERERLKALAVKFGVQDRVDFAGMVSTEEMKRYLKAATCFVFPSVTEAETFGIAQVEAMAAGLPVINTALKTAVPHIARHEKEGLTVPPRDVDRLREAMQRIVRDEPLRQRLASAAAARAEDVFSNRSFIERVLGIYEAGPRAKPDASPAEHASVPGLRP